MAKEEYLSLLHLCLQYPEWGKELSRYTNIGEVPEDEATRLLQISRKMKAIDQVISESAEGLDRFLFMGVCHGLTYTQLQRHKIPCSRGAYYEMRKRFYFKLSRII